jgi:HD-GYP domain-containing protein (c-di-GMP phosphodiesterase class II)
MPEMRDALGGPPLDCVNLGRGPGGLVGSGREEFWSQSLPCSAFLGEAALSVTARNLATLTWDWLVRAYPETEDSDEALLEALLVTLRGLSPHSVSHSQRVALLAGSLADELGLSREELELAARYREVGLLGAELSVLNDEERDELAEDIRRAGISLSLAGRIHDVGKLHIPPGVLSKAGPLTDEERAMIRLHPLIGESMLRRFEHLRPVLPAVRSHHERWDGAGYPDGLEGEAIPLSARLLSLADSYDAMTGRRPYRDSVSPAEALAEIVAQSGKQFDPHLTGLFVRMVARQEL